MAHQGVLGAVAVGMMLNLAGCGSVAVMRSGKTQAPGTWSFSEGIGIGMALGHLADPDAEVPKNRQDYRALILDSAVAVGVTEEFDLQLRYVTPYTVGGEARVGVANEDRGAAASVALGVGYLSELSYRPDYYAEDDYGLYGDSARYRTSDLRLTLYVSRDVNRILTLYAAPGYIRRSTRYLVTTRYAYDYYTDEFTSVDSEGSFTDGMAGGAAGVILNVGPAARSHMIIEYSRFMPLRGETPSNGQVTVGFAMEWGTPTTPRGRSDPPAVPMLSADDEYAAASRLYIDGDFRGSWTHASSALAIDRAHWRSWQLLGNCQYALGDKPGALVSWNESLRLNPANEALRAFVERSAR